MRTRLFTVSFALLSLILCASPFVQASPEPNYYLALGDSLSIGIQPSLKGDVPTDQGYPDDLHALLRLREPGLSLVKLGCSGETSATMITGGICSYAEGNQLATAVSFLETHPVSLLTIDIGANDVDQCFHLATLTIDEVCVATGITNIANNLPYILSQLQAASPHTLIVAMNYYDPFLAAWKLLPPPEGQNIANESLLLTEGPSGLNGVLESVYGAFHVPVADVASAFRIADFAPVPIINLPVNVFITLTFTWMAAPAPLGPDVHPNAAGYAAIAGAFAEKIAAR